LVLKEEILITKQRTEQRESQTVTLRSEEVTVERVDGSGYPEGGGTDIA
jgi:stress response protein YsnF